VVHSDERLADSERNAAGHRRALTQLETLQRRWATGKLTEAAQIGAAAARILTRWHEYRYYGWEYTDGRFRFFEHPVPLKREEAYEDTDADRRAAPHRGRRRARLQRAQRGRAGLRQSQSRHRTAADLPRTDPRVEAHIFVAPLAFLLHRTFEKKLKAAGLDLPASKALQMLRTVRLVEFTLGRGQTQALRRASARAATILAALGITDFDPPTPPTTTPTVM
jgi:hypothetical protein